MIKDVPSLPADADAAFLAALDASPALMWLSDAALEAIYFNTTWTQFTGQSLTEEVGRGWMRSVHAEDLPNIAAAESARKAHQPFQIEYRLRRHDGAWRSMLDSGRPCFDDAGKFAGYVGSCIDITERRHAEDALTRSDERLRLAQEAAGIGTYDWDVGDGAISWSPEMFLLYGIDPATPANGIYEAWLARLHPDDRERADAETKAFVATADDLSIEFRINHPTRGERWIQGRGRMRRDPTGRATRMTGVNFDITEQRLTEEGLRASEQRIRDIAENFPGIIFRRITYPDGRVEYPYFSGADEAVLNLSPDRLVGVQSIEEVSKLIHYDDLDEMLVRFRHATETLTPLELEGRVVGDGDKVTWVRSVSRPRQREDGALVWDGVILNVTEQHQRRAERERATAMLQMSMEVAGVGTWEYDPASEVAQGSPITNRTFGLPEDGLARPLDTYMNAVHPDDVVRVRDGIIAGGKARSGTSREYRILGATGEERWISSTGTFVSLADGTERIIGALSDVTAAKLQEAERESALRHQEALLKELNHRVKNNLQLVLALLVAQARGGGSDESTDRLVGQVEVVADLHARLSFVTGAGQVDFAAHLEGMVSKLRRSTRDKPRIVLHMTTPSFMVDLDRAVPLGIAVHVLLNSIARQVAVSTPGSVELTLDCDDTGQCSVTVTANPDREGATLPLSPSDLRLIVGMCTQIDATFEQVGPPGVAYRIALAETLESP